MSDLFTDAAWTRNPVWVQMLGLCPLLAVSSSVVNALGLAVATAFVLLSSQLAVSVGRRWIAAHLRLPLFVLIVATSTTLCVIALEAFAFQLYIKVALFVQIIVTNCMILGRLESFAQHHAPWPALLDAAGTATGFAAALLALGAVRELLATGGLFRGMDQLFGPAAVHWVVEPGSWHIPLWQSAPGAFIAAAVLLATVNAWRLRTSRKSHQSSS